jgi:hypothetical protein
MKDKPPNVVIHHVTNDISNAERLLGIEKFDVIVVDGLDRWKCAELSLKLLAEDGVIILDDAQRNNGPKIGRGFLELYREAGLFRIDFYGYSPGNCTQHCTSMFFRERCFLIRGDENPKITLSFW